MSYESVTTRIVEAARRSNRNSGDVFLLPVSKKQLPGAIERLYNRGLREFGESRAQELLEKRGELPADIRWHFIGHLQSKKARKIASFIDSVHSIDSIETAKELSKRSAERTIKILIEVNISGEMQKQGVAPYDAEAMALDIAGACPNLLVSGLMGMASFEEYPERTRSQFRLLRELRDQIRERRPELISFKELSMGMSNDFEIAIEEGATIVRIGSALFEGGI